MYASSSDNGPFGPETSETDPNWDMSLRREKKVRSQFWSKFARVAGKIPFADDLAAAYYCAFDSQTPIRVRGMLLGALAYFILPTDAIPDFLVGVGYTDDAAVLATVITLVTAHIKPRHRAAAAKALGRELPEDLEEDG